MLLRLTSFHCYSPVISLRRVTISIQFGKKLKNEVDSILKQRTTHTKQHGPRQHSKYFDKQRTISFDFSGLQQLLL